MLLFILAASNNSTTPMKVFLASFSSLYASGTLWPACT
jgi:hypothetical protein